MLKGFFLLLTAHCLLLTAFAQSKDYTKWVNPFIGTGGHGHTFPGATMPFGMVQLSPDTRIDNWDGSSGYHYSDDIIYGFSHTHLSGTGIPDGCDILFAPFVSRENAFETRVSRDNAFDNPLTLQRSKDLREAVSGTAPVNGPASRFDHSNERSEPGYYSVVLDDESIRAELTATKRVGLHRYTFPTSGRVYIGVDLKWRDKLIDSELTIVGKNRIEGFRRSSSWAKDQTIYFAAEFSKPFVDSSINVDDEGRTSSFPRHRGEFIKASFGFDSKPDESILVKVAISFVSIEGARKNLEAELPHWDFDKVRADAKASWNKELSKIEVSGGTDEQTTTFYTALYHTMIHPNIFSDVDGQYKGHDGKIHQLRSADTPVRMSVASTRTSVDESRSSTRSRSFAGVTGDADKSVRAPSEHYTVFSLWDTFRATHPLYTIIDQRRTVDFINTFIRQYEQGGRLPVWELWGEETDTMIGYHAVSVIADAMVKGIKGFDYEKAYAAAKHSAELDHFGLKDYKRRGYISMEDEHESVSKTLEYAYNDWCIAQMAKIMGEARARKVDKRLSFWTVVDDEYVGKLRADYPRFSRRARYFENLFDPLTGFMRPKKNGGFVSPFAPNEVTFNFTEGNSWVYSFFVPHDVGRLMELMGGREKFGAKLDELFTTKDKLTGREQPDITGLIGQYAHGNEPSHHIPYLYNYAGQPWKTQQIVRRIMDDFYKNAPDGLIGNEDCGQMSAWYVMSASGFYPVAPGGPDYQLGSPLFSKIKYDLENGRSFAINVKNRSAKNIYVESVKLNGAPYDASFLTHADLMKGGELEFTMTDKPGTSGFKKFGITQGLTNNTVAVPVIDGGGRVFQNRTTISLSTITPGANIFYTTDGSPPTERSRKYTAPFSLDTSATVWAIAVDPKGEKGLASEARFIKKPNDWTVKIASKYNRQYTGGGDEGLIDGIRGSLNFASGEWQGYQDQDLVATVDLQRPTEIKRVGGGFLQDARPWIWMPTRIEIETSMDGVTFARVADIKTDVAPTDMKPQIRDYVEKISPVTARYVRIHAYNLGKIPAWHPGAGFEAFIFVDEIIIE